MYAFLSAVGTWLLQIFLGGLFGTINQHLQDQAAANAAAGAGQAQSTVEATNTDIAILQAQQAAQDQINAQTGKPDDPFSSGEWNQST